MANRFKARRVGLALSLVVAVAAAAPVYTRQGQGTPSSGEQGRSASEERGASPSEPGETATRWRLYRNRAHSFSVKYPTSYVIMRERGGEHPDAGAPRRLARVRFQDRKVLSYQTADLEPPQFSIEVFENRDARPLREWLEAAGWLAEGDSVEGLRLDGADEGLRVRSPRLMAPNEFYFYRAGRRVYRLTTLGRHGAAMLDSFRLGR